MRGAAVEPKDRKAACLFACLFVCLFVGWFCCACSTKESLGLGPSCALYQQERTALHRMRTNGSTPQPRREATGALCIYGTDGYAARPVARLLAVPLGDAAEGHTTVAKASLRTNRTGWKLKPLPVLQRYSQQYSHSMHTKRRAHSRLVRHYGLATLRCATAGGRRAGAGGHAEAERSWTL